MTDGEKPRRLPAPLLYCLLILLIVGGGLALQSPDRALEPRVGTPVE